MEKKANPQLVVDFTDKSKLATDLKRAIAALANHSNTQYRLHVCLNGRDGYPALQKLVANPSTDIKVYFLPHLLMDGDSLWLNTKLMVIVEKSSSDNYATLSPQQTGYVARSLPEDSRNLFLEKVKEWYREVFLKNVKTGLDAITKQIETGNLLLESDHGNRVFDIHGDRHMKDIPYTETEVAGEHLFWSIVHGGTCFDYGSDGYDRADQLIEGRRQRQKGAVEDLIGLARQLGA